MAISAEQLNIILSAQDKALTKALDRSTKNVNRFAKKSQQNLSRTSKSFDSLGKAAKRLAPIIAAAVSVGAARNAITLGKEIADLARVAGTTAAKQLCWSGCGPLPMFPPNLRPLDISFRLRNKDA